MPDAEPVDDCPCWPSWPVATTEVLESVADALLAGRWSISSAAAAVASREAQFAESFAAYNGSRYCVPASHGTAGLTIALEACGVGGGDEVITPALSWVASASAALAVNAVPILTDVDPRTLCLDPVAVEAAITARTRAIVVVHLYSAVADLAALLDIARRHDLVVIEDCSQSHGAEYRGRKVGTFGSAGVFSMHESKVLTCGEGGAAITDDAEIARRLFRLRSDGRDPRKVEPGEQGWSLVESGRPMGTNFALSEIHAAILLAQLRVLDEQIDRRNEALALLSGLLADAGIEIQATAPETTRRSPFGLPIRIPPDSACGDPREIADRLWRQLRVPTRQAYRSIGTSPLYKPESRRRFRISDDYLARIESAARRPAPAADRVASETIVLPHQVLLADRADLARLADSLRRLFYPR
ncbi:MAG TPA: DegT/DnrJ/EryC1/StrS family aminotransferase [Allosphingosinicella sp.]